jgi:radical SAM protein with 4Fe4S-binding SPASM domain
MATLILKVTEKCNSNCYYCDVVRKEKTGQTMSLQTLGTVFRRVDEYLRKNPGERMEILWHGGEPLLPGADYYRRAIALFNRHCAETRNSIHHSIQTNLTCFHEEFVDIFRSLGVTAAGTSYDPEPCIRGPGENIDSEAYNRKFIRSLAVLERNGFGWGMIYVVTKKSLAKPLEVFHFLSNLSLSGGFNINPVLIYDEERRGIAITPEEYVDFLGAIFPVWWNHRERYPDVQPFKSLVRTIIEGQLSLGCVESGDCTYHHVNVTPDGETSQCGRSADWGLLQYGNIEDKSLAEILGDPQRGQLEERVRKLKDKDCRGCRFWEICHGGCPLDAYSKHKSFLFKSEWCESRRGFIERYFEPLTKVRYQPGRFSISGPSICPGDGGEIGRSDGKTD